MPTEFAPRRYHPEDALELTLLLNGAHRELQDMGLNFTAATRHVETTRRRVAEGACWVVDHDGRVAATTTISVPPPDDIPSLSEYASRPHTGLLCQVAVGPQLRSRAVAKGLFEVARDWAVREGIATVGLDTAAPAEHLLTLYPRWGFEHVDNVHFPGKSYDSVVMTRELRE